MKKVILFIERKFDILFVTTGILVMFIVLIVNLFALRNNMTYDEAWYLCLLRDLPHVGVSRYHLLFHNVFNNNIYTIRLVCWLMQLIAAVVLAGGISSFVYVYCKSTNNKWLLFIMSLVSVYYGQMYIEGCPSLNYITLNKIVAELGIGFLLFGNSRKKMIWYLLSGFTISFLFPIMITNVIIIPLMLVEVLLVSDNKCRDCIGFCLGIILFAVYYFVFVESPKEVVDFLVINTKNTIDKGSNDYGVSFLFLSLLKTFLYLSKCFLVAVAIYGINYLILKVSKLKIMTKYVMAFLITSMLMVYAWVYIEPAVQGFPYKQGHTYHWQRDVYWVLLFMAFCHMILNDKKWGKKQILMLLMALIPVCLWFGSNVLFEFRDIVYLMFVSPILVFYCIRRSFVWKTALVAAFGLNFILFLLSIGYRNWQGQKYFGNHIPVESIGIQQNISLEKKLIDELDNCKNHIPSGRVLCTFGNWPALCLLDYEPICYIFNWQNNGMRLFKQIVENEISNEGHLWIISYLVDDEYTEALNSLIESEAYDIKTDTTEFTVYTYITEKQFNNKDPN